MNILIIEDDIVDFKTIELLISKVCLEDVTIYHLVDGEGVLNTLNEKKIDLVILDYSLPGDCGLDVVKTIRQNESYHFIPIIFLTGLGDEMVAAESIKLGAQDYLSKDLLNESNLKKSIENALNVIKLKTKIDEQSKDLIKKNHQLEKEIEYRSEFFANMSHEIRTPLTSISGLVEILSEVVKEKEAKRFLKILGSSCEHLNCLINEILDLTKLEQDQLKLENIEFDIREIIEEVVGLLSVKSEEKGLGLFFHVEESVSEHYVGDPLRLKQILINLVGNAIKFTIEGDVNIMLEVEKLNKDDDILKFSINDTGVGIEPNKIQNIFDKFNQGDQSTSRKFGGTGLGLSISKKIIENMKGEISVKSTINKGSTFSFSVPLKKMPERMGQVRVNQIDRKLLLVDDEKDILECLQIATEDLGIPSILANSGEEALRLLSEDKSIIGVVTDNIMPRLSGLDLVKQIRETNRNIPVIFATGLSDIKTKVSVMGKGVTYYLEKPFKEESLKKSLRRIYKIGNKLYDTKNFSLPAYLNNANILLADDTDENQFIIDIFLKDIPINLEFASNGAEALEKMLKNEYQLVLMDMQMPVMNGYKAVSLFREKERARNPQNILPIIALTAFAGDNEIKKCLDVGCTGYLAKPFKKNDILDAIIAHSLSLS